MLHRLASGAVEQKRESSLKYQTRCIHCYPDGRGYALGSVEGRVAMEFFEQTPQEQANKYAFKVCALECAMSSLVDRCMLVLYTLVLLNSCCTVAEVCLI